MMGGTGEKLIGLITSLEIWSLGLKNADFRVNDVKFQGAFPPEYSNLAGDLFISMNLGSFS